MRQGGEIPAFFIARAHPTSADQSISFCHDGAQSLYCFFVGLFGVAHCASELLVPLMTSLLVLFTNHPHLTHLVSTCTTKFRSSRLSFSLRLENCLLRLLPTGGTHGAPCGNHQDGARKEQNFFHVSSVTRTQYASDSRLRRLGEGVFSHWLDPVLPHLVA